MLRPQLRYSSSNTRQRGSSLIGALVMVGILSLVVGVMLSSSRRTIQSSRDRILYEEAYQAAVSGTHVARAWLIDPDVADSMNKSGGFKSSLESLVEKARTMNRQILTDVQNNKLTNMTGTTRFASAGFSIGTPLSDGRVVLLNFPQNGGRVVNFYNEVKNKNFTTSLFNGSKPSAGYSNYVDMVRITTPEDNAKTSTSLRETTFVIESRGIAEYAGIKKERVVKQRVLIYPNEPAKPLLSAGEAILTQAGMTITGSSHANVHWAPVLAKGNIEMEFLSQLSSTTDNKGNKTWTLQTENGNGKKYNGAGVDTVDPNFKTSGVTDTWLKWMTGANGQLLASNGQNLFGTLSNSVSDFFAQVKNNQFAASPNLLSQDTLTLGGQYIPSNIKDSSNTYGLYAMSGGTATSGALVQRSSAVDTRVDEFFSQMNYQVLKDYAKSHNGYYVWNGSKLLDAAGNVATMPDMANLVPSSGYDPLDPSTMVNDRILFIDSYADRNSNAPNNPFTSSLALPKFWKGVMYINGNVSSTGTGSSPDLLVRTPTQFQNYRAGNSSGSYQVKGVLMDGILVCNGLADLGGNTAIYGTLAAKGGLGLGGTPSIFYNSLNSEGRLKNDDSGTALYRVIAGRLIEDSTKATN